MQKILSPPGKMPGTKGLLLRGTTQVRTALTIPCLGRCGKSKRFARPPAL